MAVLSMKTFFDGKAVLSAVGKARAKVLGRQGALVRTIARRSMRRKKGSSAPGSPPNAHLGYVRDFLFFSYDPRTQSVVVGPVTLPGKSEAQIALEFGGTFRQLGIVSRDGKFIPLRFLSPEERRKVLARGKATARSTKIDARPFMNPALETAKPMLAKMWEGQVKK